MQGILPGIGVDIILAWEGEGGLLSGSRCSACSSDALWQRHILLKQRGQERVRGSKQGQRQRWRWRWRLGTGREGIYQLLELLAQSLSLGLSLKRIRPFSLSVFFLFARFFFFSAQLLCVFHSVLTRSVVLFSFVYETAASYSTVSFLLTFPWVHWRQSSPSAPRLPALPLTLFFCWNFPASCLGIVERAM